MLYVAVRLSAVLWCLCLLMLIGCAGPQQYRSATYDDPFSYCAAVGTIDAPDARYTGDPMPELILRGMVRQGIVSADAPPEFRRNAIWRCMDGGVWVCLFGANIPCRERADTARMPTPPMEEFCRANPSAAAIPAAVTGRATAYEWTCRDGKATAGRQVLTPDGAGYPAEFWYELKPQ